MADKFLSVTTNKPGATEVVLVNGEPSTTGFRLMAPDLGSAAWDKVYSGARGTQGAVLTGAAAQNRVSTFTLQLVGTSKDDLHRLFSILSNLDDELRRFGGTVSWRAQDASFLMSITALDCGLQIAGFDRLFEFNQRLTVAFGIVSPPFMSGQTLDFLDDFSTDSEANYAIDAGSGADLLVTGGALTVTANPTTEKRLIQTARGYSYGDVQVTLKPTPGSTITSFLAGVVLKRIDASNYLRVYVDDNGTNSRLRIDKVVAGVTTNLATTNLAARVVNGTPFWVRGRIEGVNVFAEHFTAAPSPMATPTTSTSYTLSTAEQTTFGETVFGQVGLDWIPQQSAATLDDFDVQAYVYRNWTLPDNLVLRAPVYGDADSLCDVEITPSGGAAAPIWALFGWWRRPGVWNRVWNGDFESALLAASGWSNAAVTNINGAATSIARITTTAKYGTCSGQIVCPATSGTGANFRIFRRFRKGVTYTIELWIHSAAGTTNVQAKLGNAAANDVATSGSTALSSAWQRITVAWTPTADRDDAHLGVVIAAATATTFEIDGVMIYEGTVAPTSANQSEGRGGFPPLGVIEAESSFVGTISADAAGRSGFLLSDYDLKVVIDPSLLVADDYTQSEIALECWLRIKLDAAIATQLSFSARPLSATANLPFVYAEEFGSALRSPKLPSAGTAYRFLRLGTIRLPTNAGRWMLAVSQSQAVASVPMDYLLMVPSNARALSPSGKTNDVSYPTFVPITTEITKRIRANLSGTIKEPSGGAPESSTNGLGGSLLEFPVGNVDAVVKLASLVPDDPTSSTSTEQLSHSAAVHFRVTPRWRLGRSS